MNSINKNNNNDITYMIKMMQERSNKKRKNCIKIVGNDSNTVTRDKHALYGIIKATKPVYIVNISEAFHV